MGGSIMYCRCGHESVVTDSPPETGGSPRRGRGWINLSPLTLPPCRGIEGVFYTQLAVPNVVAIAVRMVITMLRILPQVLLLLNVPIV